MQGRSNHIYMDYRFFILCSVRPALGRHLIGCATGIKKETCTVHNPKESLEICGDPGVRVLTVSGVDVEYALRLIRLTGVHTQGS